MFLHQSIKVMERFRIRKLQEKDKSSIFSIWAMNQDLATGFAFVADTDASIEQDFYKNYFSAPAPVFLVAETVETEEILGWASILNFIHNPILTRFIGEASIYLDKYYLDAEIGTALIKETFAQAAKTEIRHIYGWIKTENAVMIKLAQDLCEKELAKIPNSLDGKLDGFYLYFYNVPR